MIEDTTISHFEDAFALADPNDVITPGSIVLRPWQESHAARIEEILSRSYGYLDPSIMGAGKGYIAGYIAQRFDLKLFVVCPSTVAPVWAAITKAHAIPVAEIISYQKLRVSGRRRAGVIIQPNHPYLIREDPPASLAGAERSAPKTKNRGPPYVATDKFRALLEEGILLVIDEAHYINDNNEQYRACFGLTKALIQSKSRSRYALLSATPFVSEERVINLLRLTCHIDDQRVTDRGGGVEQLLEVCRELDPTTTGGIAKKLGLGKNVRLSAVSAAHACYKLYIDVLHPKISSAAVPPAHAGATKDARNGYYELPAAEAADLRAALAALAAGVKYDPVTRTATRDPRDIGAMPGLIAQIEYAKIPIFVRLAKTSLATPGAKVILSLNRSRTIDELVTQLQEYDPLVLRGTTPIADRGGIVAAFQNDPTRRLLVCNTLVAGEGINLHDPRGDSPRFMYISPSYSLIKLHQATGRVFRDGTVGTATIRFIYAKSCPFETGILEVLTRKTVVLGDLVGKWEDQPSLFPGELPIEIEGSEGADEDARFDFTGFTLADSEKSDVQNPSVEQPPHSTPGTDLDKEATQVVVNELTAPPTAEPPTPTAEPPIVEPPAVEPSTVDPSTPGTSTARKRALPKIIAREGAAGNLSPDRGLHSVVRRILPVEVDAVPSNPAPRKQARLLIRNPR